MYRPLFIFLFLICIFLNTINATVTSLQRQVITFPEEAKGRIYSAINKCAGSESKAAELIKIVQEGKVRDDEDFKTFIHCAYKESGYAFENGRVNVKLSFPLYPDPVAMQKVMDLCDQKRGNTAVETTFEFFKCFQDTSPFLIGASVE
nr:odorant binding protein 8 [Apocheima cinerarius]